MINRLRTTLSLCTLLVVLMAPAIAQAQPKPLPPAPEAPLPQLSVVVEILSPGTGKYVTQNTTLVWTNEVTPKNYKIKLTADSTGKTVKFKVPLSHCVSNGNCAIALYETTLLKSLKDGEGFTWQVIGKTNAGKIKSPMQHQAADTVTVPTVLSPDNDMFVLPNPILSWNNSPANSKYVLVIRNATTNKLVAKVKRNASECEGYCKVSTATFNLKVGKSYTWFVKAKGPNGDVAKSVTRTMHIAAVVALH